MSTVIRPEVSKKNQYWIEKHRYYELKHFCLQYPNWKKVITLIDGLSAAPFGNDRVGSSYVSNPTERSAIARSYYVDRMQMIENSAYEASKDLAPYIIKGVTDGLSYDIIKVKIGIPCSKDVYYDAYRRFFWILDRVRA